MKNNHKLKIDVVISAAKFEAEPVLAALNKLSMTPKFFEIGVGAINAAKNAEKIAAACKKKSVLFVGSAGIFGKFSKVYLLRAHIIEWLPTATREKIGYSIPANDLVFKITNSSRLFDDLPKAHVICSSTISLRAKQIPNTKIPTIENLELFSCAREISSTAKDFTAILGITNAVGPSSHEQWLKNWRSAAKMISSCVTSS